jgi:hypothetical protein
MKRSILWIFAKPRLPACIGFPAQQRGKAQILRCRPRNF